MKNLILLCLSLLTGQQCAETMETLSTNKTVTLHRNINLSSLICKDIDTSYGVNSSNTTTEPYQIHCNTPLGLNTAGNLSNTNIKPVTTYQTHRPVDNVNQATPESSISIRTNFSHTTSVYDANEKEEIIYTTSKYHNIATTLSTNISNILDTDKETYSIHLDLRPRRTSFLSDVDLSANESDLLLVNATTVSKLIDETYTTDYSYTDLTNVEITNDHKVKNESKLEVEVDDQEERNEKEVNGTDSEEKEMGEDGDIESYEFEIYWTAYTIWNVIGFVGIVANVCLLMVFVLRKEMRTYPNVMIINLAISDILSIIFNVPLHILERKFITWHTGDFPCKLYILVRTITFASSTYSVVIISLQRAFALSNLFTFSVCQHVIFKKYKSFLVVLSVWILAALLASRYYEHTFIENLQCYVHYDVFGKMNEMVSLIIYCVIPLTIIGFSYVLISIQLKKSIKNMPGEVSANCIARRDRVVSSDVLLALTIVFATSYVPFYSYYAYQSWNDLDLDIYTDYTLYALSFSNICFNPIAIFIMSRKYRRVILRDIICRKKYSSRNRDTRENSTITIETRL